MSRFNEDLKLLPLTSQDWELYSSLPGAGLVAHNLNTSVQAALNKMLAEINDGSGVLTAAKRVFHHVESLLEKHEEVGANTEEARGVLLAIIEEYTQRRFEVEIDLYWEVN